jgi:NAD(P)-dependent dehydrogenase (short-subunit alcohol dehydrogenase family)
VNISGARVLVTGSSRGIGAAVASQLARLGATVVVHFREKQARADKLVESIAREGGSAFAVGADITDTDAVSTMFKRIGTMLGGLDLVVLNASGGLESGRDDAFPMRLNRDAQVRLLDCSLELLPKGGRVVFVTSHQAHFVEHTPVHGDYRVVALSKRAGEDALRARIPELSAQGIDFVVVSGDMIEGTITVKLLERREPGVLDSRRRDIGRLYSVEEFATEIVTASTAPIPTDHTHLVGDTTTFRRI